MDFEFAAEHESFRKEFRDWLATNLPLELCLDDASDDRVASDRETFERRRVWQKTMHAAAWVGITWPKEYGGRDAGFPAAYRACECLKKQCSPRLIAAQRRAQCERGGDHLNDR